MVYTVLNGRLGNNLFQIAAGASLAKRNNSDLIAQCQDGYLLGPPDSCFVSEYVKQFQDNILKKIKIEISKPNDYYLYNEPSYKYQEIPYHENIRIKGWFQSEKYFDKELVQELFKISPSIEKYILDKYGDLFAMGEINSINVRRGDYLKLPHQFPICSIAYYKKAIAELGSEKRYLIISDDIEWCKQEFVGTNFTFIDDEEPIIDLYLQTFCANNIISNSTFSWWAAWLNPNNEKKIVCPTPWFGKGYKNNDEENLIPESWIKIRNKMNLKYSFRAFYLYKREQLRCLIPQSIKNWIKAKKHG